ncbi:hypothetical protein L1887_59777 [Cichorium endivia]|nr:hypothetical protein L1887_59777 [Cichorium endivia]
MDDDAESRVHLLVHDLKPPFLDGKTVFTKQLEPINPVKDGLSDMAVFARKGSRLVRETREKAERAKAAGKVAAMGGTTLGNILGVKADDDQDDLVPSQPAHTNGVQTDKAATAETTGRERGPRRLAVRQASQIFHGWLRVDPHWLAELGGAFYSIKERNATTGAARAKRTGDLDRLASIEEQMKKDRSQQLEHEKQERERSQLSRAAQTPAIATPGATPMRSRGRRF